MTLRERINLFVHLGEKLLEKDEFLDAVIKRTQFHNPWLTGENQRKAVKAIATQFLTRSKMETWLSKYELEEAKSRKTVGIVMAGNLPLVGFHDFLCVVLSGNKAKIKLSDKDPYLFPYLLKLLERIEPLSAGYFEVVEKLENFDAVIATGSNNTARYFETYFGKYPNIIRKNRNSVAVLTGQESEAELLALGNDIFQYFGLGCRNVSKIYVPQGFDFQHFLEVLHEYRELVLHDKYKHNFDYNFALYSLNKTPFLINGCLILVENTDLQSRIAALHYEHYDTVENLTDELQRRRGEIQCVVSRPNILPMPTVSFGKTQEPELCDYADGVDTMAFLKKL